MYDELQGHSTFTRANQDTMADEKHRPDYSINYIELHVNAIPGTKKFYADAFGWSFQDWGPDYASFSHANVDGGITSQESSTSGSPLVILYASKLEEAQARVEKAGGRIVKPIFSFPGGRRFHFTDPAGNELAIWSE
jgi:predicted enzyme related to lactoylglutathione lyase